MFVPKCFSSVSISSNDGSHNHRKQTYSRFMRCVCSLTLTALIKCMLRQPCHTPYFLILNLNSFLSPIDISSRAGGGKEEKEGRDGKK